MVETRQGRTLDAREIWKLTRETGKEWVEDKAPKQAAALAYYALFALGPLLLLAISIAGLVFGAQEARATILSWTTGIIGASGAEAMADLVAGGQRDTGSIIGLVVASIAVLAGAAGLFGQLKETLNVAWEVQHEPRGGGWMTKVRDVIKENIARFLAVLAVGALLLAALVVSTVLAFVGKYVQDLVPGGAVLWYAVNIAVSVLILSLAFAALFKWLPDAKVAWRDVWVGGALTAVLFTIGQFAISLYLGQVGLASRYGAAGAVIVLLLWVYYSGLIFLFGAEFTQVFANRHGSHVRPEDDARTLQEDIAREQDTPPREGTRGARRGRKA